MDLDLVSLTVRADADRPWQEVEARLRRSGLTLGWAPPIGGGSAVGEILASGAPGLRGALYGQPADGCLAVEAIIGGQRARTPLVPRSAAGADFRHLIFGGEGRHAPLTACWLRAHPRPEGVHGLSAAFLEADPAARAMARLLQRSAWPAFALLEIDAGAARWSLVFEGAAGMADARCRIASRLLLEADAELGDPAAPVDRLAALDEAVTGGQTPDELLFQADLSFDAPWRAVGRAAEAVLERLPALSMAIAHPTLTGARLLLRGLSAEDRVIATAAAVGAGARLRGAGSLLDMTFASTIGSLADAEEGPR